MRLLPVLGILTLLLSFSLPPASAQRSPSHPSGAPTDAPVELDPQVLLQLRLQQQKKRYEDMKRDSQKLLELATELKHYVDKAGTNILSMEVVHKAEEMEKLARQVKNNMKAE
jgi:hypothetical protein